MANQLQTITTISPQPLVAASPARLSSTDLIVREVLIESSPNNKKAIYIATSEANATSLNRHVLNPGDAIKFNSIPYGNLNATLNLFDIWYHGETIGERIVVTYQTITESFE